jgi:hypothetical protein
MPVLPRQYVSLKYNTYQVAVTMGNALKNRTHTHEVELLSYNVFIFGFFHYFPFYEFMGKKSPISSSYSQAFLLDFSKGLSSLPDVLQVPTQTMLFWVVPYFPCPYIPFTTTFFMSLSNDLLLHD